jgi:hypothetical protein
MNQNVEPERGLTATGPRSNTESRRSGRQPLTQSRHLATKSPFLNKPTVAIVKQAIVANAMTFVMDQAIPLVKTPPLANIGVSHRYVVPNNLSSGRRTRVTIVAKFFTTAWSDCLVIEQPVMAMTCGGLSRHPVVDA